MMKTLLYTLLLFVSLNVAAQTKISPKLYAQDLKQADLLFEAEDYLKAINAYRKVLAIDPAHEKANLNSLISRLKIHQSIDSCSINSEKLKNSKTPESIFYIGKTQELNSYFDDAIISFEKYKGIKEPLREIPNSEVDYEIACCKRAKEFMSQPQLARIKNVGAPINTSFPEYVPLISLDGKTLYFTSRRTGSTGDLVDAYGNYYEDVYVTQKNDKGEWDQPKNIGAPINTKTHDACVALSFDGNQMIIYRTAPDQLTGDLYISKMGYDGWSEPQKFGPEINTPHIETSACFSNDTSVIYFSSNKPGGLGGKDLYRIKKLPNGRWSLPMNLGPTINTERDEDSPFLHPDGITLYFSSKGHNTMGGYDIYKTVLNAATNQFSSPENLGYPINSINDDIFFVMNIDGTKGYYSSVKEDSKGSSDIYEIDTRFGSNDLKVKHCKVIFGTEPQKAKITVIDIDNKQISGIYNASAKTGKFLMVLNPLKPYKAIVEEDGFQTMIIDIEPLANEKIENPELILSLTKKR